MTVAPTTAPGGGKSSTARRWSRRDLTFDRISFLAVFLILPLIGYITFVVSPFIQAVYYSLTDWSGFSATKNFIGLDNYKALLSDDTFKKAVVNNLILLAILPLVTIFLALVLASLVTVAGPTIGPTRGLKNSSFYRVVSFFPYVVPAVAVGMLWNAIYAPKGGLLNGVLVKLGFHGFDGFAWTGTESTARWALMFVIVWSLVGFYMVLFIAAIKGVPAEIFEAAKIDGAGRFTTAWRITIPLIRDNVQTAFVYMGIVALDAFVYVNLLNADGGPNNSVTVITQQLYGTAFQSTHGINKMGLACAMGVVLAAVTLLYSGLVFLVNKLTGGSNEVGE